MKNKQIKELVLQAIKETTNYSKNIKENDLLVNLGYDSLLIVDLIIALEDKLKINFDMSLLIPENLKTVDSLINMIQMEFKNETI